MSRTSKVLGRAVSSIPQGFSEQVQNLSPVLSENQRLSRQLADANETIGQQDDVIIEQNTTILDLRTELADTKDQLKTKQDRIDQFIGFIHGIRTTWSLSRFWRVRRLKKFFAKNPWPVR